MNSIFNNIRVIIRDIENFITRIYKKHNTYIMEFSRVIYRTMILFLDIVNLIFHYYYYLHSNAPVIFRFHQ